ncbi:hypothetical protein [Dysgonomonas sp. 25]|uniref:hypothetical protein n=1 Tax=Dysgonomonas sp. 25 TaxID=2302933 RepID=UPI0013D80234|nr:hypothetical protein [Dysgonomonas sp. 25]NDV67819.1 hypothetical protein [Dysgonomonas sp. 25]
MKKVLLFALGLSLAAVSFTSCSDDDPSLTKQFDHASENYTDLLGGVIDPNQGWSYDPIYGKVKSVEEKEYSRTTWNSTANKPVASEADLSNKIITEYNKSGFVIKTTDYDLYNDGLKIASVEEYTLDSKNRPIFSKRTVYTYSASTTESYVDLEYTITYNDKEKKATRTGVYYLTDGTVYGTSKTVFDLYKNGRINYLSYTNYTRALGDDMNTPNSSHNLIKEDLDNHKNWTVAYYRVTDHVNNTVAVTDYTTRTIVYY